ncbi:hypothetical protein EJ03DRAFT_201341 [Teratosphaeria nubilosa]|uniref:Uncharacterized protein n=1 Tax=Teratosphaeria nubilosa TaxID=161662 RepID=A0A6G1LI54_9PEZI|nr:hypothetical protein EJ03DRAFT_201341 [Teratosphaeria nubilosa]
MSYAGAGTSGAGSRRDDCIMNPLAMQTPDGRLGILGLPTGDCRKVSRAAVRRHEIAMELVKMLRIVILMVTPHPTSYPGLAPHALAEVRKRRATTQPSCNLIFKVSTALLLLSAAHERRHGNLALRSSHANCLLHSVKCRPLAPGTTATMTRLKRRSSDDQHR